jgi:hypothetical protein
MDSNQKSTTLAFRKLLAITFRKFVNFLGYAGLIFIIYGSLSTVTDSKWDLFERIVDPLSSFLTILGTLITTLSIYFYSPTIHKPEMFSRYISAPIVIVLCTIAIIFICSKGSLAGSIVNGFALLGLAGGLFRIQPRPEED